VEFQIPNGREAAVQVPQALAGNLTDFALGPRGGRMDAKE
jgi:hypothetical protein